MIKTFIKVVVGGAIGAAALYAVGKIAYEAGHDMAEMECRYEAMRKKVEAPKAAKNDEEPAAAEETAEEQDDILVPEARKPGKLKTVMNLIKLGRNKDSVVGNLINNNEIQLTIKPKTA